jgi:ABC-type multidrug transport system fused ATPase/permease subunit
VIGDATVAATEHQNLDELAEDDPVGDARAVTAEATSNLDVATETRVTEAMRRLRQGRTTIVIAHRLSTVAEADQVAVIEDGRVVETGPPEELLAGTGSGRFADLYGRWLAGAA